MRPIRAMGDLDCFERCVGAVLGLPAELLPDDVVADEHRVERWRDWLNPQGWDMLLLDVPPLTREAVPRGYWVAVVESAPSRRTRS